MKPNLQQSIQDKAYEIWEANGQPNDKGLDHWLQAEREIDAGLPKPKRRPQIKKTGRSQIKKTA